MRKTTLIVALAMLPAFANAQELPAWVAPAAADDLAPELADAVRDGDQAGRDIAYPLVPASAPLVVREGLEGDGVCQGCHTTTGMGGPQSAPLAGLPKAYFVQQILNFQTHARGDAYRPNMGNFARQMTLEQIVAAADYYASLPAETWVDVVETEMVPETFVGPRDVTAVLPGAGEEPYMNGQPAFTAYVPVGSVAQGRELAERGVGRTVACTLCHGADLNGNGDVPGIAGRSPIHNARQLMEYRNGMRGGVSATPMLAVVDDLTDAEIIAISAYVASLPAD
jgi:cytochrome c553